LTSSSTSWSTMTSWISLKLNWRSSS